MNNETKLIEALADAQIANAKADLALNILQQLCYALEAYGIKAFDLKDAVDRRINNTEEFGNDIDRLALKDLVDRVPFIDTIDYQFAKAREKSELYDKIRKSIQNTLHQKLAQNDR